MNSLPQVLYVINHWFHLMSAVIWVGGLAFLVMAVTPGLQKAVPKEFIKPIVDVFYKQYRRVVGVLLGVILFTGGVNFHYVNQILTSQTGLSVSNHPKYLTVFFIKLGLVLMIMTFYLYTVLFRTEATGEETEEDKEEHRIEPIPFQRASLWMGVLIILCAAALKHLHQ